MLKTNNCNELRKEDAGKKVVLCGWVNKVRNLGSLVFIDLRDTYGMTQISLTEDEYKANPVKNEY